MNPLRLHNRHTGDVFEPCRPRHDGVPARELRGSLPPRSEGRPMHVHVWA